MIQGSGYVCASARKGKSALPNIWVQTMPPCSVAQYELVYHGVTSSIPNCWTTGEVGSAQNVATRKLALEYARTSSTFCGSVITVFRKVTPALKILTLRRSMMLAKRPALGNTGAPSAMTVVTRVVSAPQIM